jgi:preprotein translocase subunit SecE
MFQALKQFLAEARAEFKKISWPNRDEIRGSTLVVLFSVFFILLVLLLYDVVINKLLSFVMK